MGKVMIIQLCVMLLYITYRGIFCEEVVENVSCVEPKWIVIKHKYLFQYQVNPEIQNPFSKLSLRDLMSYLEANRQNDLRYAKRSDKRDLTSGTEFDPSFEINTSDPETTLKNLDLLWQTVEEEISE